MNTVKRWLATTLSFAMVFTSSAFANVNVYASTGEYTPKGDAEVQNAVVTITNSAGSKFTYNMEADTDFQTILNNAKAGDSISVDGTVVLSGDVYVGLDGADDTEANIAPDETITLDLSKATVRTSSGTTYTINPSGKEALISEFEKSDDVWVFSGVEYNENNMVIDVPSNYSDSANHGVQVSFTQASGEARVATFEGKFKTVDSGYTKENDAPISTEDLNGGKVYLNVATSGTEPTCDKAGNVKLTAEVLCLNAAKSGVAYKKVEKDYGAVDALGHNYGTVNNGIITLPAYRAENIPDYDGANYGIDIRWAIRGSGPNIKVDVDNDGYTKIDSIKTKCRNESHGYDVDLSEAQRWNTASATIISTEPGTAATSTASGSTRYTLKVVTADNVELTVKQTVYDIPGTEATDIAQITNVGFETLSYTKSGNTYSLVSSTPTYEGTIYADYTPSGDQYKRSVIAENGDLSYRVEYTDQDGVAGKLDGVLTPVTTGSYKSATYSCGANTFYYSPIKVNMIADGSSRQAGSTANIYIGGKVDNGSSSELVADASSTLYNKTYARLDDKYATGKQMSKNYFIADFKGTHTLDMADGTVTVTKPAKAWETGTAKITCSICGKTDREVVLPMETAKALYELNDGTIVDADGLASTEDAKSVYIMDPMCETKGYSYHWSVNQDQLLDKDSDAFTAATIDTNNPVEVGMFYKAKANADDTYHFISSSNLSDVKKNADLYNFFKINPIASNKSSGNDVQHWAGIIDKIAGTETDAIGHRWVVSDANWKANKGTGDETVAAGKTDADVECTITYTCRNHTTDTTNRCNTTGEKKVTYFYRPGTDAKDGSVLYSAIEKSITSGKDCTEHNTIVYTVKGVKNVFDEDVKKGKVDTAYGTHTFADQINWSEDGKKATVTRTCSNKKCTGDGTSTEGGYNTKPLVVSADITKADQEDGSYLYTASYGGETIGTKKVVDLTDAKITVNGGEAVDNNVYTWTDDDTTPEVNVTINGITIDPSLYTIGGYVNGYVDGNRDVASVTITAKNNTEAYGSKTVKFSILNNNDFVDSAGALTVFTYTRDKKAAASDDNYTYDEESHTIVIGDVYGKARTDATNYSRSKLAASEYKAEYSIATKQVKDPSTLEYVDKAELTDAGVYYVYVKLSAKDYTTRFVELPKITVNAMAITDAKISLSKRTMTYGDTITATTGNSELDARIGLKVREDLNTMSVGEYAIEDVVTHSANYSIKYTDVTDNYNKFQIVKRNATIVLKDVVKDYDGVEIDPQTLYTVDGTVNGDTLNVQINTEGNKAILMPGTYNLVATANDANYEIAKATATVTINATGSDANTAQAAIDKINALTDKSTAADVAAARKAYDALSETQKALVNNDTVQKLVNAEAAAQKAAEDAKAAEVKAKETATKTATTAKTAAAKVASTNPKYSAVQSAVKALDKVLADKNATSAQIKAATDKVNTAVKASKTAGAKKGATYTVGGQKYKATSTKAVTLTKAKNAKSVTVPATVKINGKKIAVTKIGAKAFAKSKATKVTIKTKKLTKKGVKNSLKGSKVKTVKVSCGKAYVKKYKKFFTKANAGKKVTVK